MKALSVPETQNLALELKTLEGSRFQEVIYSPPHLFLGFYHLNKMRWLVFDLSPMAPQVLSLASLSGLRVHEEKKPIVLFLKAHFIGHRLQAVVAPPDLGRVILFRFGSVDRAIENELELRLFPRGQNVLLRAMGKELSLFKPSPLKSLETLSESNIELPPSVLESRTQVWLEHHLAPKPGSPSNSAKVEAKILKSIEKASADLEMKRRARWADAGEWLKVHGYSNAEWMEQVPVELREWLTTTKSVRWNIENCFRKSKELKEKIHGSEKRVADLSRQLEQIRSGGQHEGASSRPTLVSRGLNKQDGVAARTFDLGAGLTFFVGKSAQDNLRLLRLAKGWHFWLHLRDVPSCHGILHRNKGQVVSDTVLHQAAHHLVMKNRGEKFKDHDGDLFDVIVAECRFVRPIKGEKAGRVTYTHERVLAHRFSKKS